MAGRENSATRDYYAGLGLPTSATMEEIRAAYYRLALTHHPDRPGGDASKFRRVHEAYEFLTDPEKKTAYDRSQGRSRTAESSKPTASGGGFGGDNKPTGFSFDTGSVKAKPFVRTGQGKFAKSNYWDTHERPPPK
jgi:DnaJ-class molecular chaperone